MRRARLKDKYCLRLGDFICLKPAIQTQIGLSGEKHLLAWQKKKKEEEESNEQYYPRLLPFSNISAYIK